VYLFDQRPKPRRLFLADERHHVVAKHCCNAATLYTRRSQAIVIG
jgi:hypothetical protein